MHHLAHLRVGKLGDICRRVNPGIGHQLQREAAHLYQVGELRQLFYLLIPAFLQDWVLNLELIRFGCQLQAKQRAQNFARVVFKLFAVSTLQIQVKDRPVGCVQGRQPGGNLANMLL